MTLIEEDKNVRLVFVEVPILGPSSQEIAEWALASLPQERYLPFHIALMRHRGPMTEEIILDYAKKAGLDVERLKKDQKDPKIAEALRENQDKTMSFGISGTPAFIIGDQIIRGYVGIEGLREIVKQERAKKAKGS